MADEDAPKEKAKLLPSEQIEKALEDAEKLKKGFKDEPLPDKEAMVKEEHEFYEEADTLRKTLKKSDYLKKSDEEEEFEKHEKGE